MISENFLPYSTNWICPPNFVTRKNSEIKFGHNLKGKTVATSRWYTKSKWLSGNINVCKMSPYWNLTLFSLFNWPADKEEDVLNELTVARFQPSFSEGGTTSIPITWQFGLSWAISSDHKPNVDILLICVPESFQMHEYLPTPQALSNILVGSTSWTWRLFLKTCFKT